jgi:hypothetical protein
VSRVLDAIRVETARRDRAAQMRVAACLKRLGYEMRLSYVGGKRARVYEKKGEEATVRSPV